MTTNNPKSLQEICLKYLPIYLPDIPKLYCPKDYSLLNRYKNMDNILAFNDKEVLKYTKNNIECDKLINFSSENLFIYKRFNEIYSKEINDRFKYINRYVSFEYWINNIIKYNFKYINEIIKSLYYCKLNVYSTRFLLMMFLYFSYINDGGMLEQMFNNYYYDITVPYIFRDYYDYEPSEYSYNLRYFVNRYAFTNFLRHDYSIFDNMLSTYDIDSVCSKLDNMSIIIFEHSSNLDIYNEVCKCNLKDENIDDVNCCILL